MSHTACDRVLRSLKLNEHFVSVRFSFLINFTETGNPNVLQLFFTDKVESKFIRIFTEWVARRVNMSHSALIQKLMGVPPFLQHVILLWFICIKCVKLRHNGKKTFLVFHIWNYPENFDTTLCEGGAARKYLPKEVYGGCDDSSSILL